MALVRAPAQGTIKGTSPSALLPLPGPTFAFSSSGIVNLLVEETQTPMSVHESFITRTSEFFATALKKAWIEGQTRVIKLPEEDPVHLAYYLDWTYTRKLPTDVYRGSPLSVSTIVLPASYNDSYIVLSHLYVLGERMLDTKFRNSVLEEFIHVMDLEMFLESPAIQPGIGPSLQVVNTIYQGTTSASPARRLVVDWCLGFGQQTQYTVLHEKEFLFDVAAAFSRNVETGVHSCAFRGVSLRHKEYIV